MKVKELIEKLEKEDPEADVLLNEQCTSYTKCYFVSTAQLHLSEKESKEVIVLSELGIPHTSLFEKTWNLKND